MADDARRAQRVRAQVPLRLKDQGGKGVTVDISATGVFFVTEAAFATGEPIRFSIEFENSADPAGVLFLECQGEVVRVEQTGQEFGVGIRILESRLERRERGAGKDPETARTRTLRS